MSFVKKCATKLRRRFNTDDIRVVTSALNIDYLETYLTPRVKGLTGKIQGRHYIVVNNTLPHIWKKAVAFHELGHVLLHDTPGHFFIEDATLFPIGKFERQANEFAAEYLIPDEVCGTGDIRVVAGEIGVPVELFEYKRAG